MSAVNFNKYRPPVLEVVLSDANETVLQVTPPTVDLQDELRARKSDLKFLLNGGDDDIRVALYDLAARLMSCNRNMRKIVPEDLRKKYNLVEADLIVFFDAYADFLTGLENAKN